MRSRLATCAAVVAAGLSLQGCDCTQVGCFDEVRVEVRDAAGVPVLDFSGELVVDGRRYPFHCVPEGNVQGNLPHAVCLPPSGIVILRVGEFPERFELRIEGTSGGRYMQTLEPAPEVFAPNGERCGPVCDHATVSAPLG